MSNTKQQHTPGPWFAESPTLYWVRQSGGKALHVARTDLDDLTLVEQRANAARIVACVNACEGIDTDALAAQGKCGGMRAVVDTGHRMRAERDVLAFALRKLLSAADKSQCDSAACDVARTALAALEGTAKTARAALAKLDGDFSDERDAHEESLRGKYLRGRKVQS